MPDETNDKPKKNDEQEPQAQEKLTIGSPILTNPVLTNPILNIPILLLAPVINSLSPSGGIVGGNGFVLTVNGSRFVSGSVVQWNGGARPTTFVSATQLTAAILASDIAAVGQPAVTVVNPAPGGTSNAVAFSIISDVTEVLNTLNGATQNFTTLQQFQALQPGLITALSELKTYLNNEDTTISNLQSQLTGAQTQMANLTSQNSNLNAQVAQQQTTITQLQAQVAAAKNQTASPVDIAKSFKGVVDQIQQAALNAGGVQTTLTNMNVQLKALVSVQQPAAAPAAPGDAASGQSGPEAVLVFPDPTALPDPNHLSTLTFSFGAIPNLKSAATPAPPSSSSSAGAPSSSSSAALSSSSSSGGAPSSSSSGAVPHVASAPVPPASRFVASPPATRSAEPLPSSSSSSPKAPPKRPQSAGPKAKTKRAVSKAKKSAGPRPKSGA